MLEDSGLLHDYAVLSMAFDELINYFLKKSSWNISEHNCVRFKEMIIWTRTIEKMLFENLEKESEFVTVTIFCYFNVIVKHFLPMIEVVAAEDMM